MLNISQNTIQGRVNEKGYSTLVRVNGRRTGVYLQRLVLSFFIILFIFMFVPWTQNVRARGKVTTLKPQQRPQTINSIIAGRIEKWFVQEGDIVKAGDTILFISEIKDEFFDPQLLERTDEQLVSKELSVSSYMDKVRALDAQIDAMSDTRVLKLQQAKNKLRQADLAVQSDSINLQAAEQGYAIAKEQLDRMEKMYKDGLKSLTELEGRRMKLQEAEAKKISSENKWISSQNEWINARVEISSIETEYRDKISKAESEKYTAMSSMYDAEAVVTKMQNQRMNYSVRSGYYYITAPQDGFITRAIRAGIGETLKEGEQIVTIMPANYDLAIEMYVRPVDLPLMERGQHVRIQFDGWPAIVFSGWPQSSFGTFGGTVFAIDNFSNEIGEFRVLVVPDPNDPPWPESLRIGGGAYAMSLLKDVPVYYEMWRQINGFPPDYYKTNNGSTKEEKK
jgi:multidrug resistance efflux pump